MAGFMVNDAVYITPPGAKHGVFFEAVVVQGVKYIELKKGDRKIEALLVGDKKTTDVSRPLARTSVIEMLTELRDSSTASKCGVTIGTLKRTKSVRNSAARELEAKLAVISGEPVEVTTPDVSH